MQPLELSYPIVDTVVVTFYSDKQIISAMAEGEPFRHGKRITARESVRMLAGAQATTRYAGV